MNWYIKVLKQYADFSGRARRTEFWMFALFNLIFSIVASTLDAIMGLYIVFGAVYGLIIFIPGLAVSVRRLHDLGKSGWMLLIALIPVIGAIWLLVLMATDGQYRINQYGENPKKELLEI